MRTALALVSICLAVGLGACGDDDDDKDEPAQNTAPAPAPTTTTPEPAEGGCQQAEQPPAAERKAKKPAKSLASGKTYSLTFTTNCGEFTIRLDPGKAPKTASSLVSLAEQKFFDGTAFHRVVPGFVIQGGDPTASGSGGPGYSTVDKPPADAKYTKGIVAMAKTGEEAPGTAGSQFFVVVGADARLPADYAVVGEVSRGMETVERIGEQGDASTQQPLQPIVIEKVTVQES